MANSTDNLSGRGSSLPGIRAANLGSRIQLMVVGIITAVIFILVGVSLGPTVISTAAKINATALTSVTLGSVLTTLASYIAFFYYLAIVLGGIAMIWGVARSRA